MGKIVKEYEERRLELLDTAQALFFAKGYEQTSVNDIITAVGIAKGTFYHYFKSKEELLNELIDRIAEHLYSELEKTLEIECSAIEKLNGFFRYSARYKLENKETIIVTTIEMYRSENILFRKKLEDMTLDKYASMLVRLVEQGVEEGVFKTEYPDLVPRFLLAMGTLLGNQFAELILNKQRTEEDIEQLCRGYDMYQNAIERVLGAPEGSVSFISKDLVRAFLE